jgi:glycosyltransferase involved in cell wall biosynthesis
MRKLPTITVITPSYNQGSFIKETIDSVLEQNYPNLEYWVIDGGSTDSTVNILKSYKKKIKWISEKDAGQTDAINKGLLKAKGEIVCYLNSDDVFFPGTLVTVAEVFSKNPDLVWVTGDYQIIDAGGKEIQSFVRNYKRYFRHSAMPYILYVLNCIVQPSTFWKRSIHKKIGLFDQTLRYCMDYDFWLRLLKIKEPIIINQQLSKFRIHSSSKGGSQYDKQFEEETKVLSKYTQNILITALHSIHSAVTVLAYRMIK